MGDFKWGWPKELSPRPDPLGRGRRVFCENGGVANSSPESLAPTQPGILAKLAAPSTSGVHFCRESQ